MGEVVVANCEEGMEVRLETEEDQTKKIVRWEKFLPRMVLRVLLVEADDCSRQIIAALLRKCSYRVAAVPDGLKAWEILKRKASDIDLILTEVELPSISGFSLLTLIMEHDICKNIPVIMMSSHDSNSMVLKCILKGGADFLIKPVRRNELRNLWQHVWRRHEIRRQPQNLTLSEKKLDATSENYAASNHSSGSVGSTQKNNECSEKGSETQATSQLKCSSNLSNIDTVQHEQSTKFKREPFKHNNETGEKSMTFLSQAAKCNRTFNLTDLRQEQGHDYAETENRDEVLRAELSGGNPDINTEIDGCNNELVEPSRGAIDMIATFKKFPENYDENCSLNGGGRNKCDFDPQLEFSLRRYFPGSSCKQATEEKHALNPSKASAFSWYSGCKLSQPLLPTPSISSAGVNNTGWNSHETKKLSGITVDTSHQYGGTNHGLANMTTLAIGQSGQVELRLPNNQLGPFPATEVTSDHKSTGYGNVFPSIFYIQSGIHSIWSPKPVCQKESSPFPTSNSLHSNPESHNSERYHCSDDATYTCPNQTVHDKSNLDPSRHDSPAADLSTSNSLCHDTANHIIRAYRSTGRSDGSATSDVVVERNPEIFGDCGHHNYNGFRGTDSHRSSQREAALTKFRLKRKDRCYEKKVRYQSRKRLAEQRPRVKGQFVRQLHNDHPLADAGGDS